MEVAYQKAIKILKEASIESGFLASTNNEANYQRVWTRDSVVCGLAAIKTADSFLVQTFSKAIETIFKHQHPAGFFPSNVNINQETTSYGGAVGRTDNVTWAIIGLCKLALFDPNLIQPEQYKDQVEKGFNVLEAWEFNGKHLVYMPQSGNWADEYYQHGYILSEQLLRIWALELAYKVYKVPAYIEKSKKIRSVLVSNFHQDSLGDEVYLPLLARKHNDYPSNYWLAGFNPSSVYTNFDLLANTLAMHLKLGSNFQQQKLMKEIQSRIIKYHQLLPSFDPAIQEQDAAYNTLKEVYSYQFRNHPGQFHNGGLWPVWNGFLAHFLQEHDAITANILSQKVKEACQAGGSIDWEFNECLDAKTNMPNGIPACTWSAAGLILSM